MNIHQLCVRLRHVPLSAAVMAVAIGLAAWSLTSPSVRALSNAQTFLSGGGRMAAGSTLWTHPGSSNACGDDFRIRASESKLRKSECQEAAS